jgi:hypothetical protein
VQKYVQSRVLLDIINGRTPRTHEKGIVDSDYWRKLIPRVNKLRLSRCEPTTGKEHLLEVLKFVKESKYPLFILETNGIILGNDKDYVKRLSEFKEKLYVRVSFKAATSEGFTQRTEAIGEFYQLPFRALKYLLNEGIYARAAAMTNNRITPNEERKLLIQMFDEIDPKANYAKSLEEEVIDAYDTTIKRLKAFKDKEFAKKLLHAPALDVPICARIPPHILCLILFLTSLLIDIKKIGNQILRKLRTIGT